MKINEVESLAGISKKNIRFYEDQGLIHPGRNAENGYRDYTEEDVRLLRRIRLLRKLDVPIEEIRQMLTLTHTVGDGMRRHLITLEREERNLHQAMELCRELSGLDIPISQLDAEALLARMEELEQSGTSFHDAKRQDIRVRYIAPVAVTAVTVLLMCALTVLVVWLWRTGGKNGPPLWLVLVMVGIFVAVGVGTVLALWQRIREIRKGEIDDARQY